jgi:retinol dehydrogenase-14
MWKTNFPFIGSVLKWVMGFFARTPEQGADTVIYLASSPEVEGITGKYFADREAVQSSPLSYDEEAAQRLWQISEDLTRLHQVAAGAGI